MNLRLLSGKIEKGTAEAAGFDLFYAGTEPILIGDRVTKVATGVRIVIDPGYCAIVREKSGLAAKGIEIKGACCAENGIESKGGLIDSDYRGEWVVMLRKPMDINHRLGPTEKNLNDDCPMWQPFLLEPGMKVAQFIILPVPDVQVFCEGMAEFVQQTTIRGEGGFGSTGK